MKSKTHCLGTSVWILLIVVVSYLLYCMWIPDLPALENPLWDESDRARDAMDLAYALRTFDLLWVLNQTIFFQTWGPLFSVFAQLPILIFGPEAKALSFLAFVSFIGTGTLFFWSVRRSLGFAPALAVSAFTFMWIVSFYKFGAYWIIFMLEGWIILSLTGIALAGVTGNLPLLAISLWLLFLTKFQYFPVLFLAVLLYVLVHRSQTLTPFFKELIRGRIPRFLAVVIVVLLCHVAIMKVFGPIYGKSTWNGYRAIRNPLVVSWIFFCLLLFLKRTAVFQYIVTEIWERKLVRWFFWPAFLFMAFPWPNRWGAVALTSNYGPKQSFTEKVQIYSHSIWNSWVWPEVLLAVVISISVGAGVASVVWFIRGKNDPILSRLKTPHFLVVLIFACAVLIQLIAVNNTQERYAWVIVAAAGVGLFALILNQMCGQWRVYVSSFLTLAIASVFTFTPYFSPNRFFLVSFEGNVGQPYKDNPSLFPLESSLGPLLSEAADDQAQIAFGILQPEELYYWDMPLRYWLVQNKIKTGIDSKLTVFTPDQDYCSLAKKEGLAFVLESNQGSWRKVPCSRI